MSQSEEPRYTPEVLAAMQAQGLTVDPAESGPPEGMLRYHLAVEQTQQHGVGKPATVAAVLRALADEIDSPRRPVTYRRGPDSIGGSITLHNTGAAAAAASEVRDSATAAAVRASLTQPQTPA